MRPFSLLPVTLFRVSVRRHIKLRDGVTKLGDSFDVVIKGGVVKVPKGMWSPGRLGGMSSAGLTASTVTGPVTSFSHVYRLTDTSLHT